MVFGHGYAIDGRYIRKEIAQPNPSFAGLQRNHVIQSQRGIDDGDWTFLRGRHNHWFGFFAFLRIRRQRKKAANPNNNKQLLHGLKCKINT